MRTPLAATRTNPTDPPEAELVGVDTDGDVVRLDLDDGTVLELDRRELLLAVAA